MNRSELIGLPETVSNWLRDPLNSIGLSMLILGLLVLLASVFLKLHKERHPKLNKDAIKSVPKTSPYTKNKSENYFSVTLSLTAITLGLIFGILVSDVYETNRNTVNQWMQETYKIKGLDLNDDSGSYRQNYSKHDSDPIKLTSDSGQKYTLLTEDNGELKLYTNGAEAPRR